MVLRRAAALLALVAGALAACLPVQRGQCATDSDCAGGFAGSFCADGLCRGPPRVTVDSVPAVASRRASVTVRAHVDRGHGAMSAQLALGSGTVAGAQETAGVFRFEVPLSLAPAGVEGPVAFAISATDDLGHTGRAEGSLTVDDRAPRLTVDAASVPAAPVLRGTLVTLRLTAADLTAVTLAASPGTVTALPQGAFEVKVDTAQAAPQAGRAQVAITATDAVGNAATAEISFPLTRLKWIARYMGIPVGLALTHSSVMITGSGFDALIADRQTGASRTISLGQSAVGDAITDDTNLISARADNRVCKIALDGTQVWCCDGVGALSAGPALYGKRTLVAGGGNSTAGSQRLVSLPETPGCNAIPSETLTDFGRASPSIAIDGTIYTGAVQGIVAARLDDVGVWLRPRPSPAQGRYLGAPALYAPDPSGAQRMLLSQPTGIVDLYSYPASNTADPQLVWSAQIGSPGTPVTTATLSEDGIAVVGSDDRHVVALNPDGTQRWSTRLADSPSAPPTQGAGGVVYVGSNDGTLTALSVASGAVLWTYAAGTAIRTPPAAGCDGTLYFATQEGLVFALATDTVGLAASGWPRAGHDVRGTADARRPLRSASGGCLE